jgi:hypothetical protein
MRATLSGMDAVLVVSLCDVQRLTIRLATGLNRPDPKLVWLAMTPSIDPAQGIAVCEQDLEVAQLCHCNKASD